MCGVSVHGAAAVCGRVSADIRAIFVNKSYPITDCETTGMVKLFADALVQQFLPIIYAANDLPLLLLS